MKCTVTKSQSLALSLLIALCAVPLAARVGTLLQQAPTRAAARSNPYEGRPYETQRRARLAGGKLFARECASCHGDDGEGNGKAPPLNRTDVRTAAPGNLFWILRNGSLNRGMPSFAHLPEPQRWQIVTYIQTLPQNRAKN